MKTIQGVGEYDVGLVTSWTGGNYGGLLTQFAMYKILRDYGLSVLFIERPMTAPIKAWKNKELYRVYPYQESELLDSLPTLKDMRQINDKCKMFLVGSDQLFNNFLYNAFGRFITLDWVRNNKRKIGYAISFGQDYIYGSEFDRAEMQRCLQRFDAFSIREMSGVDLVKREFDLDTISVLDPVFVCKKKHFDTLAENAKQSIPEQPYYFAYILDPTPQKQQLLEYIQNKTGKHIYVVGDMLCPLQKIKENWGFQTFNWHTGVRVEEWLSLVSHSEGVITDSFHATCFAIIYNKNFVTMGNKARGDTRFHSILGLLNLEERIVHGDYDSYVSVLQKKIDYQTVNAIIEKNKMQGIQWLEGNLFDEYPKKAFTDYDAVTIRLDCIENDLLSRIDELQQKVRAQETKIAEFENLLNFPSKQIYSIIQFIKKVCRKAKGGLRCYKEHGLRYTIKRFIYHCRKFLKKQ